MESTVAENTGKRRICHDRQRFTFSGTCSYHEEMQLSFPPSFLWGAATAAYQIEGAWNAADKGRSIWDDFVRRRGKIANGDRGDVACDHFNRYPEDISIMADLGLRAYRLSISWPRVIPDGDGRVSEAGLDFYRGLIDNLLEHGITPFVTLFHWDLPARLQARGGFGNREMIDIFRRYAATMVEQLGSRVRHWITVNEPFSFSILGHLVGEQAPGKRNPWASFRVARNLMLAHAAAYHDIKDRQPESQVGIAQLLIPTIPRSQRDREASERADHLINGIFMDPLFHGAYPDPIRKTLHFFMGRHIPDARSIAGTYDFLGLNHYFPVWIRRAPIPGIGFVPVGIMREAEQTAMGWPIAPDAFERLLGRIRSEYGNPPVYVTENGAAFPDRMSPDGSVSDPRRIKYLSSYLERLHRALAGGSDVRGYFVWSLMDNFEWAYGYAKRFGLVYVDYPSQRRIVKASGHWYSSICRSNRLEVAAAVDIE